MTIPRTTLEVISGSTDRYRGYVQMNGAPKDLTGDRIRIAVWRPDVLSVVIQKDSDAGDIELGSDGVYRFKFDPTDTQNQTRERYEYGIKLFDSVSGDEIPLEIGEFHITHTPL